ncbi:MAG TPA: type II secretion system protein [Candidatus Saccharimonadales bacterium]|nr:type II secretion system protein [Candidatus Saccharimonadales bacterium]
MAKNSLPSKTAAQRGYTLLELLLYMAIISILLAATTAFLGVTVDARVKNQTVAEVNDQGVAVMDYIMQTIRNASSITAPAAAASSTSLTLVVPTGSLSPTVFSLSGTTLQVKEGAAAAVSLTNSKVQVTSLTFTNLTRSGTSGAVQVSFVMSRTNPNAHNEYDYQKTFISSAEIGW